MSGELAALLRAAWDYAAAEPGRLIDATWLHLQLAGAALVIALGLCLPLGVWIARREVLSEPVIGLFNGLRVVPSLAVLFLMVPVSGIGCDSALVALVVLACPPVLLNTHAAFKGIDPAVIEAARGMGMTEREVLRRIEIPLAVPVVVAGVRTASVEVLASAPLAAFIGCANLGHYIVLGFSRSRADILLVGVIAVAALTLAAEVALARAARAPDWQAGARAARPERVQEAV